MSSASISTAGADFIIQTQGFVQVRLCAGIVVAIYIDRPSRLSSHNLSSITV